MNLILTIDDGPTQTTRERLRILKCRKMKVIWFCVGAHINTHFDSVVEIVRAGHTVANHTWGHLRFCELSTEECLREIRETEAVIETVYKSAGFNRKKKYFRFPFGDQGIGSTRFQVPFRRLSSKWQTVQNELKGMGMIPMKCECLNLHGGLLESQRYSDYDWTWTLDSKDWQTTRMDDKAYKPFFQKSIDTIHNAKSDQIVLFHDDPNLIDQFDYFINAISQ